ncbi:PAS domain-containing sensor histidine kinase [Geomonas paludis]|uniref:histidine kinase n=1 Tax=Geomonas paludis TaxID=2740185 RepID=A0A6V8MUT2_9BACT|nr:ATP-binding protein [Geomonas paludis]GFO63644.1 hypothetical protein GMPD_15630 [Geomonas paludis]
MARCSQTKAELLAELRELRERTQLLEVQLASILSDSGNRDPAVTEGEEHFRLLLDFMPSLVFLKDQEGRYVYLNATYEQRFVQGRDWLHKTDFDFWDPDSAKLFRANDAAVLATNRVHQFLEDSKDIDGNRYCWLCYKFPFTDSHGRRYLGGIGIDATDQILAQEALRASEERYRSLFQSLDEGFCTIEVIFDDRDRAIDYRFLEVSPSFERQSGLVNPTGRRIRELVPQLDEHWFELYGRIVKTGAPERCVNLAGALGRWYDVSAFCVGAREDRVVGVVFTDVTERKQREASVEAELRDLRMLQQISESLIEEGDVQGLYQRIVDAAATIMHSDCASLQMYYPDRGNEGELYLLAHRGFPPQAAEHWQWVQPSTGTTCGQALKRGTRVMESNVQSAQWMREEINVYLGNGIYAVQSTPLLSRTGFMVGMLSTHWRQPHRLSERDFSLFDIVARQAADLIERRQTEQTLTEMNLNLEQRVQKRTVELTAINKELESFCYSVTHELGGPLRTMSCFSEILLEEYAERLDPEGIGYLRRIAAAASRMGRQVEDLLMLSRVTRRKVQRETVDLSAMALEILDSLREQAPGRQVSVEIPTGIRGLWDPGMVKLALQNLVGNAWKYSATKTDTRIEFGSYCSGEQNIFFVRDNGIGFDMSYAKKIFLPFERLHRVGEFEGNGIGLATVQRVIDMHGGRVWAVAEVGQGATFYFTEGPSYVL